MNAARLFSTVALLGVMAGNSLASPTVTGVSVERDGGNVMRVSYTLDGGPAIVTVDVLTNGVSTAGSGAKYVSGDVNRIVRGNGRHSFYWQTGGDWPKGVSASAASVAVQAWPLSNPPPYLAINMSVTNCHRFYAYPDAFPAPGGVTNILYKTEWLVMRKIPAAGVVWKMGLNETDTSGDGANRSTSHKVTFTSDYYVGIFELTRRQAAYFGGAAVSGFDARPFNNATFADVRGSYGEGYAWPVVKTVKESSIIGLMRKTTRIDLDLTTDAQWEYACRAGVATAFNNGYNGTSGSGISDVAWWNESEVHEVGLLKPNRWGLYDMHGNVWERCLDWCRTSLADDETNPVGPIPVSCSNGRATVYKSGSSGETEAVGRTARGGYYNRNRGDQLRSAHRNWHDETASAATLGFRLACPCPAIAE